MDSLVLTLKFAHVSRSVCIDSVVEGLLPPHQKRSRAGLLEAAMAGLGVEGGGDAGRPRQHFRLVDTVSWSASSQAASAQDLLRTLTAEEALGR